MNICVIIPAFNEAKNIANIIKRIKSYNLKVLVIDDGSVDNTAEIALNSDVEVIKNKRNLGKGASLIRGFDYALKNNFDAVITMDADGQHLPEDLPKFIQKAKQSNNSIFIGNRMLNPLKMPLIRKLTNRVMSFLISLIIKQKVPDTQCGFRLIKRELLEKLKLNTKHYDTESEIIIKSALLGYAIESIPIRCVYESKKSQINPIVDTFRFIWFLIKIKIRL